MEHCCFRLMYSYLVSQSYSRVRVKLILVHVDELGVDSHEIREVFLAKIYELSNPRFSIGGLEDDFRCKRYHILYKCSYDTYSCPSIVAHSNIAFNTFAILFSIQWQWMNTHPKIGRSFKQLSVC